MKRPTWVTIVGVLGILFGSLGIMNATQTVVLPQMLEWQKTFMHSFMANMPQQPGAPAGKDVAAAFESFWGPIPGWFKVWCVVGGLLGLCLSATYIYAAISMLQLKRNAVRLFCVCSAAAIGLAVVRGLLAVFALRLMGASFLMASTASIAFHVVLLLVTATGDKSAFREPLIGSEPTPIAAK